MGTITHLSDRMGPATTAWRMDNEIDGTTEWDSYADSWDDDEDVQAYAKAAFESLGTALTARGTTLTGARVIDFGCGTGLLTEQLIAAGATVCAVDTSPAMLGVLTAKIHRHGWRNVETAVDLPTEHGVQDVIACSSVCAFLEDYPGMLKGLAPLLRPGGLFVQWDWERTDDEPDSHGLTRTQISDSLSAAGFTGISVSPGFAISMGGPTMSPLMGCGLRPDL